MTSTICLACLIVLCLTGVDFDCWVAVAPTAEDRGGALHAAEYGPQTLGVQAVVPFLSDGDPAIHGEYVYADISPNILQSVAMFCYMDPERCLFTN